MPAYVYDACAIVAYLRNEAGADAVEALLSDPGNTAYIHNGNLIEVLCRLFKDDAQFPSDTLLQDLNTLGIQQVDDMSDAFWISVARLRTQARLVWQKASYLDGFIMALAQQKGATIVTSDNDFRTITHLCNVLFFR